jgi:hypothetical protein
MPVGCGSGCDACWHSRRSSRARRLSGSLRLGGPWPAVASRGRRWRRTSVILASSRWRKPDCETRSACRRRPGSTSAHRGCARRAGRVATSACPMPPVS